MKMYIIVGIFILISRENLMFSWAEHEKNNNFITSGPGLPEKTTKALMEVEV